MDHVSLFIEDMRLRDGEAESTLKEQERIWKANNKDLLMRVEKVSKEKAKKEVDHTQEI